MRFRYSRGNILPELVVPVVIGSEENQRVKDVDGKIDTGADMSVIPGAVRAALNLPRSGVAKCRGARGEKWENVPTYIVRVRIAGGQWLSIDVVETTSSYMLLGRDVLNHYVLVANGPDQIFDLSLPLPAK
jgi:hypothetical protein